MNAVEVLRKIREESGVTVHELVEVLGYNSDGSVANVLKIGKTSIKSETLVAFARVLGYKLVLIPEDPSKESIEIDE